MTTSAAKRLAGADSDWIIPDWPIAPRVQALVTTRNGGASIGAHATLNLGDVCGDDPAAVAENRRRVQSFLPSAPIWLRQVHGDEVVVLDSSTLDAARAHPPVADAAVTHESGVVLAVMVADCLPVLLADRSARVIGVAHAGWRGLARGVVENVVAAMDVAPGEIVAWLGPAIGQRAFEVGEDVVAAFDDADVSPYFEAAKPGKWHADLYGIARAKLSRAGARDIHGGGFCTFHDAARFFSYRRDRDSGRMAALLWLAP
jgi:YfiH family protein